MSRTIQFRRLGTATLANTTGANGELIINTTNKTLTVHDGTTPGGFALLNAATDFDIDQYARNTSNTNASDIVVLQGINSTQNTNIVTATNLAQAAFNQANTVVVGPTGATGPQGEQGPIGPQGEIGAQGPAGADGLDGDSAYQVAANNGFSGTEQQWLDSLVGSTTITNNYPAFTNVLATINKTGGTVGTPTAIDLTKFVNKLSSATNGRYTLADGVEGQLMYLTRQDTGSTYVRVANARVEGTLDTDADLTFQSFGGTVITLLFIDGAWQQGGGEWAA
jgi:hypothetical protein